MAFYDNDIQGGNRPRIDGLQPDLPKAPKSVKRVSLFRIIKSDKDRNLEIYESVFSTVYRINTCKSWSVYY